MMLAKAPRKVSSDGRGRMSELIGPFLKSGAGLLCKNGVLLSAKVPSYKAVA